MAMPTSVEKLSTMFPSVVGWYKRGPIYSNLLHLNGFNLCADPKAFPLQSRVVLYKPNGEVDADFYTPEIHYLQNHVITLNDKFNSSFDGEGLYEVSTFSKSEEGLKHPYYNESWASVLASDGSMEVNYPMLITRGACPPQFDASTLYYPGISRDDVMDPSLLVLNHNKFKVNYTISLISSDGKNKEVVDCEIGPKSTRSDKIKELSPNILKLLDQGPGMLLFHFEYKLNAYIQTYHAKTGYLYGMDHLGIMFASFDKSTDNLEAQRSEAQSNRLHDDLICYCLAVSKNDLIKYRDLGEDVVTTCRNTQAGKICKGCIPDIESIFQQKIPGEIF